MDRGVLPSTFLNDRNHHIFGSISSCGGGLDNTQSLPVTVKVDGPFLHSSGASSAPGRPGKDRKDAALARYAMAFLVTIALREQLPVNSRGPAHPVDCGRADLADASLARRATRDLRAEHIAGWRLVSSRVSSEPNVSSWAPSCSPVARAPTTAGRPTVPDRIASLCRSKQAAPQVSEPPAAGTQRLPQAPSQSATPWAFCNRAKTQRANLAPSGPSGIGGSRWRR